MKLFYTPTSPYARKVRVMIRHKKLQVSEEVANPWQGDVIANPLGKIPYLLLEDPQLDAGAQMLVDSKVIAEYLDQLPCDQQPLIPIERAARFQALSMQALADGITDAAAALVMSKRVDDQMPSTDWEQWQLQKVSQGIAWFDQQLQDQFWLAGDQMSLADISLVAALDFIDFRRPDIQWKQQAPHLQEWFECCLKAQYFVETDPRLG